MWWRPPAAVAAMLATMPLWGKLSVLELGAALVVPMTWIFFLKPRAVAVLIGWIAVSAAMIRWLATWGVPPTVDDFSGGMSS